MGEPGIVDLAIPETTEPEYWLISHDVPLLVPDAPPSKIGSVSEFPLAIAVTLAADEGRFHWCPLWAVEFKTRRIMPTSHE